MLHEPDSLRFASDATLAAIWGGGLLLAAGIAILADHRRAKRRDFDRVGWMPWTKIYFACLFPGVILIALAVKGWTGG